MYLIANFENSLHIELAITGLEEKGFPRNKILAIPLRHVKNEMIFDTINKADGISNLDTAMIIGSMSMVIGTIYGYVLAWGPIIWGLIGLIGGGLIGYVIDVIPKKNKRTKENSVKGINSVVLLVNCNHEECKELKKTLVEYCALAVGELFSKEEVTS